MHGFSQGRGAAQRHGRLKKKPRIEFRGMVYSNKLGPCFQISTNFHASRVCMDRE